MRLSRNLAALYAAAFLRSASIGLLGVVLAVIPGLVADRDRTWTLSWYNVVLDGSGALGALSGGLPIAIRSWTGMGLIPAYRWVFLLYAALNLASAALYLLLDAQVEASAAPQLQPGL